MPSERPPDSLFRKNDIVIGIMGNTHGVKIANSPVPKASNKNGPISCASSLGGGEAGGAAAAGGPGTNSINPAGIEFGCTRALGSIVTGAVAVNLRGGRQRVASQTLYRTSAPNSEGPAGASLLIVNSTRNSAFSSYVCVSILKVLSKARFGSR